MDTIASEIPAGTSRKSTGDLSYEKHLLQMFDESPFGMAFTGMDYHFKKVNASFSRMMGYTESELRTMTFRDLTHPDEVERDANAIRDLIEDRIPSYQTEKRYIRKNGEVLWGSVTVSVMRDENGNPSDHLVMVEDISERKRFQEELLILKNRYELVSVTSGQAVYDYDINSGIILWSGNTEEILGYKSEEIGDIRKWEALIHPDDRKDAMEELDRSMEGSGIYDISYRFRHKGGEYLHMHDKGVFLRDGKGQSVSMIGMMQDRTILINAQMELQENEERYRTLFDVSPSGIILSDLQGKIIDINDEVKKMSGFTKEELIGRDIRLMVPREGWKDIRKHIKKILTGGIFDHEVINVRKDGTLLDLELRETLIHLPDGRFGILAVSNDITERKKAERTLEDSRDKLENFARHLQAVREAEREYISREIHDDLGQSLTILRLDAARIMKKLVEANDLQTIEAARIQTEEMISVIDATIQSAKKIAFELRPRILDDLGLFPAIQLQVEEFNKRSDIHCRLVIDSPPAELNPDKSIAVYRIVQEALTNILRHSGAANAMVRIRSQKSVLTITITDNGIGLTEKKLRESQSLGILGMNERASLLDGTLKITGKENKGTKVELTVPLIH
jgi:two-component system, NarL family, sensor histidine kinase UhpB